MTTTWGEFKRAVESQGVSDDIEVFWIDWSDGPVKVSDWDPRLDCKRIVIIQGQ